MSTVKEDIVRVTFFVRPQKKKYRRKNTIISGMNPFHNCCQKVVKDWTTNAYS